MQNIKKLDYIDALRGLSILLVLLVHIQNNLVPAETLPDVFVKAAEQGRMGVQLFFMISAFTMFYSLSLRKEVSYKSFFLRRIFRVAPMFYAAIALYYLYIEYVRNSLGLVSEKLQNISNLDLLSHITFTHAFSPAHINSIIPGGWSVGVEMLFYLLVPAFYILYKRCGGDIFTKLFFVFITLAYILNYIFLNNFNNIFSTIFTGSQLEAFVYFYLPNQLPVFMLGFILYDIIFNNKNNYASLFLCGAYSLILYLGAGLLNKYYELNIFNGSIFILSILLAALVILVSKYSFRLLVNKLTMYIGKISYSMYLTHFLCIYLISFFSASYFADGGVFKFFQAYVLLFILAAAASTLTYRYIEKPFIIMGNKLIEKINLK